LAKITTSSFHLKKKESKRRLTVYYDGTPLLHNPFPTYLGVKVDRQLTYKQHTDALRAKLTSRNNLMRSLIGSFWGSSTNTLRTSAQLNCNPSVLSNCWICNPTVMLKHIQYSKKIDIVLKNALLFRWDLAYRKSF